MLKNNKTVEDTMQRDIVEAVRRKDEKLWRYGRYALKAIMSSFY